MCQIQIDQVLKETKIHVSNIFYRFLSAVSHGSRVSKKSEKLKLYHKIDFQNTFYAKCINIIVNIGHNVGEGS